MIYPNFDPMGVSKGPKIENEPSKNIKSEIIGLREFKFDFKSDFQDGIEGADYLDLSNEPEKKEETKKETKLHMALETALETIQKNRQPTMKMKNK